MRIVITIGGGLGKRGDRGVKDCVEAGVLQAQIAEHLRPIGAKTIRRDTKFGPDAVGLEKDNALGDFLLHAAGYANRRAKNGVPQTWRAKSEGRSGRSVNDLL